MVNMLHNLRLWRRFVALAFAREAEYRANVAFTAFEALVQVSVAVLTVLLLYQHNETVAGWSWAEVLLLAGVYRAVEGVVAFQIAPNMHAVSELIRTGNLDGQLLRPASSQFLVSTRTLAAPELANIAIGLALAAYAASVVGAAPSVASLGLAAAFVLCGLVGLYALWFITVTLSFWLVSVDTLSTLFYGVLDAARYPVTFFKGLGRALLTFVIPVAFATTFPTEALLGRADAGMLLAGALLAGTLLVASNLFWRYGLRHYGSASS
jgi:ABC-2 type transport system permease protein